MTKTTKKIFGFACAAVFAFSQVCFAFPATAASASAAEGSVRLESYGGTLASGSVELVDGKLPALPAPEREGYDFIGWYTAPVETKYWGDTNGDNWAKYKKYYTEGNYTYIDGKSIEWYNEGEKPDENSSESYDWQNSSWKDSRWIETSVGLASATKGEPAKEGDSFEGSALYAMYDPKNITVYWYSNGWKNIDDCWAVSTGRSTGFEYGGKFAKLPLDEWAPWAGHEFKGWVDENGNQIEFTKVTYERADVYSYILAEPYTPAKYEPILRLYAIYDGVTCRGGYVEPATVESIGGSGGYFDPNKETYTFTALFDSRYKDLSAANWEITSGGDLFDLTVSKDKTSATLSAKAGKQEEIAEREGNIRIDIRLTTGNKSVEAYATAAHDWDNGTILSGLSNPCEEPMDVRYTCRKCGQTRIHTYKPDGHRYTYYRTEATCTEDAVEERYCVVCGKKESEVLQGTAKGHSYKITTVKGCGGTVVTSTCTTCGHVETQEDHNACHDWNSTYTVDKAATCTTEGSESIRCKNCSAVKESKVIPATGHNYREKKVEATCEKDGYTVHTCANCGDSFTDGTVPATGHEYRETVETGCNGAKVTIKTCAKCGASETIGDRSELGHVWGETQTDRLPTCTAAGQKSVRCTVCGAVKETTEIPATGHSYSVSERHAATCTEQGYVLKVCSECGDRVRENTEAAKGHDWNTETKTGCNGASVVTKTCSACGAVEKTGDESELGHVWGEAQTDRLPTCTAAGQKSVRCTVCGAVKETTEIPATGHSYSVSGRHAATCTANGTVTYTCSVCGDSYTEKGEEAKGHSYDKSETNATCTEDGIVTYTCSVCGENYTEKGEDAKGHSYDKSETSATCTEDGIVTYTCSVCGDSYTEKGEEAKGHIYDKSKTSATCTEDGIVTYTCSVCGENYTEKGEDAKGHSYDKAETGATCTEDGIVTYTCSVCGDSYTEKGEDAKGHDWNITVETGCGGATYTVKDCKACGEVVTEGEREALEHAAAEEYTVEKAPTCAEEGSKVLVCAKCGEVLDRVTLEATGEHVWTTSVTEPTEKQEGLETRSCSVCGKTEETVLPKIAAQPEAQEPEVQDEVDELPAQPEAQEPAADEAAPETAQPEVNEPETKTEAKPKETAPERRTEGTERTGEPATASAKTEAAAGIGPVAIALIALATLAGAALIAVPVTVFVKRRK